MMPTFSAHMGYLFTEVPLESRFDLPAQAGFGVVEHPAPYGFGIDRFAASLAGHGLRLSQIAAPVDPQGPGVKGYACLRAFREQFRASVSAGINAAVKLDCQLLHVMPGLIAPDTKGEWARLRDTYVANLVWAAQHCSDAGIGMLIEPINNAAVPGFYMNDPVFAVSVLEQLDHSSAHMLLDVYHAVMRGYDPISFAETNLRHIRHMQIADTPGRHEPGTGQIDFDGLFDLLDRMGWDGAVGCEYKPERDTQGGLGWMAAR